MQNRNPGSLSQIREQRLCLGSVLKIRSTKLEIRNKMTMTKNQIFETAGLNH